jgi:hypothetical protein
VFDEPTKSPVLFFFRGALAPGFTLCSAPAWSRHELHGESVNVGKSVYGTACHLTITIKDDI